MRHVFITSRAEPIPRWLVAFPDALVLRPDAAELNAALAEAPVAWLHAATPDFALAPCIAALRAASPCPVVVLSNVPEDDQGLAALGAGAAGYCSALTLPDVLHQVADVVVRGGLWVGPALMRRLMQGLATAPAASPRAAPRLDALTERERQIAQAAARGSTNKEIARVMGITERTVKAHLSAAYEKLGVRDRMQLALVVNGVENPTPALHALSA